MARVDIRATQTLDRMATRIVCQLTWLQSSMVKMNWMALTACLRSRGVPSMLLILII